MAGKRDVLAALAALVQDNPDGYLSFSIAVLKNEDDPPGKV